MFRWWQTFLRRAVVADVPPELDLCLDCGQLECAQARFAACAPRKARAAQLRAARQEAADPAAPVRR